MNTYKFSNYNFYMQASEELSLIYNSISNSLCETTSNKVKDIKRIKDKEFMLHDIVFLDQEEKRILLKHSMIIDSEINEKEIVGKLISNQKKLNKQMGSFSIILLPTNACNMDCPYCFEGKKDNEKNFHTMDDHILSKLIEMLEKEFDKPITNSIKRLFIEWYGGEPLLAPDIIERFSKKLIEFASSKSISYRGKIITNGTLLSKENWNLLKNCQVSNVQITLDGDNSIHNKKRPLCNEKDSYYTILENLQHIPEGIFVPIRINVDREILPTIDSLLDDLSSYNIWPHKANQCRPYLAFKDYNEKGCTEDKTIYFRIKEFYQIENEFKQNLVNRYNAWAQKNEINKTARKRIDYPRRGSYTCALADLPYGIVIDEKGYIHKCMTPVNEIEDSITHIDNLDFNTFIYNDWADFDRMKFNQCTDCKILPVCTEDCTERFLRNTTKCPDWKFFIKDKILSYYQYHFANA